ncbi:N-acetyltransferase GCN5 [Corynebacterium suranareeae]|uniref:N-acetyltransferase GCN5 n=1 Tax=Corynebacterium suranareeae TaxID=2506452 RepID=A0A169S3Y5_9CORY|nr:GNAT family N-acetyltransferase [Corynebacterium suranareeae]BAU97113.1 N-acetyltransferase GCN5 [Corynebacterium suranareeae]
MTRYFAVSNLQELGSLEVHKLYKLRVDIFVHEQQTPYAEIDDTDVAPTTNHILAWERADTAPSRLVGCARLAPTTVAELKGYTGTSISLDDATELSQLGRVAVSKEERGTGLSQDLMHNALRLAYEQYPDRDVVLTAQKPLADFYGEYGFEPIGEEYLDSGVVHLPMLLKASELEKFSNLNA